MKITLGDEDAAVIFLADGGMELHMPNMPDDAEVPDRSPTWFAVMTGCLFSDTDGRLVALCAEVQTILEEVTLAQ